MSTIKLRSVQIRVTVYISPLLLQPMAILMIVVGAKFVTVNGHQVPVAWSIAALMLIGAIITSEMHHNKTSVYYDGYFFFISSFYQARFKEDKY